MGDNLRLRQILFNLFSNAIKFTDEGSIRFEVSSSRPENNQCHIHFTITDTGIGISHEKIHQLFQRFNQLDSSISKKFGGTGLGLSICKELVELMRGSIEVRSEDGRGTTFIVKIPLKLSQNQEKELALEETFKDGQEEKLSILLAEDTVENCTLIIHYLKKYPYRIDIASNGLEALKKAQNNSYDIILMDMQMPEMDGLTATGKIREWEKEQNRNRIPIVALTAYALQEEKERFLNGGCDFHLSKPVKKADLIQAIKSLTSLKK